MNLQFLNKIAFSATSNLALNYCKLDIYVIKII